MLDVLLRSVLYADINNILLNNCIRHHFPQVKLQNLLTDFYWPLSLANKNITGYENCQSNESSRIHVFNTIMVGMSDV